MNSGSEYGLPGYQDSVEGVDDPQRPRRNHFFESSDMRAPPLGSPFGPQISPYPEHMTAGEAPPLAWTQSPAAGEPHVSLPLYTVPRSGLSLPSTSTSNAAIWTPETTSDPFFAASNIIDAPTHGFQTTDQPAPTQQVAEVGDTLYTQAVGKLPEEGSAAGFFEVSKPY